MSKGSGSDEPEPRRADGEEVANLDVGSLEPGPFQPRAEFDPAELEQLASSVRASGVLQPILVRPARGKKDRYEILAGERRWRAAKMAGLERIPALVRAVEDDTAAVIGLVENVQRTDLNAIEKAQAFKQIQAMTKVSQAELAKQVGLERSTIANFLRLLELPKDVQAHVSRGTLTMGHARALLGLAGSDEQLEVAEEIVKKRMSVRQVEQWIQELNDNTSPPAADQAAKAKKPAPKGRPVWLNEIEENLVEALGTSVSVKYGRKRSRISIECAGREEFERVYELLKSLNGDLDPE